MNKVQQQYQEQGFTVININLGADEKNARKFLQDNPASFAVIYDNKGSIAKHFSIQGMPTSMLIGRDGVIKYHHSGFFTVKRNSMKVKLNSYCIWHQPISQTRQIEANMKANKVVFKMLSQSNNSKLNASKIKLALLIVITLSLSACSSLGVEPWERDLLAKKEMALTSNPVDAALDDHIYFSKEASSGGKSFGGGGCGCN